MSAEAAVKVAENDIQRQSEDLQKRLADRRKSKDTGRSMSAFNKSSADAFNNSLSLNLNYLRGLGEGNIDNGQNGSHFINGKSGKKKMNPIEKINYYMGGGVGNTS